jgi:hypothetical protein
VGAHGAYRSPTVSQDRQSGMAPRTALVLPTAPRRNGHERPLPKSARERQLGGVAHARQVLAPACAQRSRPLVLGLLSAACAVGVAPATLTACGGVSEAPHSLASSGSVATALSRACSNRCTGESGYCFIYGGTVGCKASCNTSIQTKCEHTYRGGQRAYKWRDNQCGSIGDDGHKGNPNNYSSCGKESRRKCWQDEGKKYCVKRNNWVVCKSNCSNLADDARNFVVKASVADTKVSACRTK